jgi:hypothetical protein
VRGDIIPIGIAPHVVPSLYTHVVSDTNTSIERLVPFLYIMSTQPTITSDQKPPTSTKCRDKGSYYHTICRRCRSYLIRAGFRLSKEPCFCCFGIGEKLDMETNEIRCVWVVPPVYYISIELHNKLNSCIHSVFFPTVVTQQLLLHGSQG